MVAEEREVERIDDERSFVVFNFLNSIAEGSNSRAKLIKRLIEDIRVVGVITNKDAQTFSGVS